MKKTSNVLWGFIFILVGILIFLKTFSILEFEIFFDGWWTLFIIIPCLVDFLQNPSKTGNLIGIFIGAFLLLACQNVITFELLSKLLIPCILVFIGFSLVFKDVFQKNIREEMKRLEKSSSKNEYFATFSSQNIDFAGDNFESSEFSAVFGEIKCNLQESHIKTNPLIKATAVFGGVEIKVPEEYDVKVVSKSLFGGVSNNRKNQNSKKIIYISATCLFGGVTIK